MKTTKILNGRGSTKIGMPYSPMERLKTLIIGKYGNTISRAVDIIILGVDCTYVLLSFYFFYVDMALQH
jgi:hypothetical protein